MDDSHRYREHDTEGDVPPDQLMSEELESPLEPSTRERIVGRLDRLVKSGRVTQTEAARLRGAGEPREFDQVIREIRVRHAGTRLKSAVDSGDLTRAEADALLERLKAGEHGRTIRAHLRSVIPGRSSRERGRDSSPPPGRSARGPS